MTVCFQSTTQSPLSTIFFHFYCPKILCKFKIFIIPKIIYTKLWTVQSYILWKEVSEDVQNEGKHVALCVYIYILVLAVKWCPKRLSRETEWYLPFLHSLLSHYPLIDHRRKKREKIAPPPPPLLLLFSSSISIPLNNFSFDRLDFNLGINFYWYVCCSDVFAIPVRNHYCKSCIYGFHISRGWKWILGISISKVGPDVNSVSGQIVL